MRRVSARTTVSRLVSELCSSFLSLLWKYCLTSTLTKLLGRKYAPSEEWQLAGTPAGASGMYSVSVDSITLHAASARAATADAAKFICARNFNRRRNELSTRYRTVPRQGRRVD